MHEAISLNALSGVEMPITIRLRGEAKKNSLTILVDSGSTHSFLDLETAKKIGCPITRAVPMRVTIADGNHILSWHTCHKFKWKIHGMEFEDSIRLLRLVGNNMVLGGDWMKVHNPVLLDFVYYKIQVTHLGKRVELRGIYHQGELKSMSVKGVKQLLKKGEMFGPTFLPYQLQMLQKRMQYLLRSTMCCKNFLMCLLSPQHCHLLKAMITTFP